MFSLTLRDQGGRGGWIPFHEDFLITIGVRRELKVRMAKTCQQGSSHFWQGLLRPCLPSLRCLSLFSF